MPRSPRQLALFLSLSLIGLTACSENQPVEPEPVVSDVLAAKGGTPGKPGDGGDGGGDGGDEVADPEVNATDPDSAPQDTTLDVLIIGTGFDSGSTVDFLLDGATTRDVSTNSTAFVSDTELRANITIDAEAVADLYDVRVTTSKGKKGVGIELFAVTAPPLTLANAPADPAPAGLYGDGGVYLGGFNLNDGGQGNGNYHAIPSCEEGRVMSLVLPAEWAGHGTPSECDAESRHDGRRVRFHIPGLLFTDCPDGSSCSIGESAPEITKNSSNFSPTLNFYFHVDADGDGEFGERNEPAYNVVWTDGEVSVEGRASDGAPCLYRVTASSADLWSGNSKQPATGAAVALEAVVRRVDGPCGF